MNATIDELSTSEAEQKSIPRDRRKDKEQVARAIACCGAVARLYRKYGGSVQFVQTPTSGSVKTSEPVKAPKRGYEIRRTIKGLR